jgi:hypothetical protein
MFSSETSVAFERTTWYHIPEQNCYEILKSYTDPQFVTKKDWISLPNFQSQVTFNYNTCSYTRKTIFWRVFHVRVTSLITNRQTHRRTLEESKISTYSWFRFTPGSSVAKRGVVNRSINFIYVSLPNEYRGSSTPGVKRSGCEADHSLPSSTRSRMVELCLHSPVSLQGIVLQEELTIT